uniref:LigA n=1 Tax=Parastrongyloides trichosuri TaxID=131310 RepID=A0A0N4ZVP7_PARTI
MLTLINGRGRAPVPPWPPITQGLRDRHAHPFRLRRPDGPADRLHRVDGSGAGASRGRGRRLRRAGRCAPRPPLSHSAGRGGRRRAGRLQHAGGQLVAAGVPQRQGLSRRPLSVRGQSVRPDPARAVAQRRGQQTPALLRRARPGHSGRDGAPAFLHDPLAQPATARMGGAWHLRLGQPRGLFRPGREDVGRAEQAGSGGHSRPAPDRRGHPRRLCRGQSGLPARGRGQAEGCCFARGRHVDHADPVPPPVQRPLHARGHGAAGAAPPARPVGSDRLRRLCRQPRTDRPCAEPGRRRRLPEAGRADGAGAGAMGRRGRATGRIRRPGHARSGRPPDRRPHRL